MSDANLRQIRVLHIVSSGGVAGALQQSLFMPLLTRLPKPRVKAQVACLSPGAVPAAVLRQGGVPVYDIALSRQRFSPRAFKELVQTTRQFRPDVIQAWGYTAQIVSTGLRKRCDWKPQLVWSVANTVPLAKSAGFIDRKKVAYAAKHASRADRIVYTSEAGASQHRRVGFPDDGHAVIPPGVDATRFKPDFAARRKLREQLSLGGDSFVIGMAAPFQPEYDYPTLLKAIGDLIKVNPNVAVVLAGHGVQKGNAPLMALVGGGTLAQRVHLLGECSDVASLYNGCDVVCSSALNDNSRMTLVMAMLCGVPCVGTGIGAQGETIGQFGVAIEPGNPAAFVKGITRVMQLPADKRTHMAQSARKHALENFVYVRSLQKYLQLYYDLIGRQSLVTQDLPTPEVDASVAAPPPLPTAAELAAAKSQKKKALSISDLSDPDSLESKVAERSPEELPQWRREQEEARAKREAELEQQVAATKTVGDVLQVFEAQMSKPAAAASPMMERARGVTEEVEDLLAPELLAVPATPRAASQTAADKASAPIAATSSARGKSASPATRPAATPTGPMTRPVATATAPTTPSSATPATVASVPVATPVAPAAPAPEVAPSTAASAVVAPMTPAAPAPETAGPAAAVSAPETAAATREAAAPVVAVSAATHEGAAPVVPAPATLPAATTTPAAPTTPAARRAASASALEAIARFAKAAGLPPPVPATPAAPAPEDVVPAADSATATPPSPAAEVAPTAVASTPSAPAVVEERPATVTSSAVPLPDMIAWPFSISAESTSSTPSVNVPTESGTALLDGPQTLSLFTAEQLPTAPVSPAQREEGSTLRLELLPIEERKRVAGY